MSKTRQARQGTRMRRLQALEQEVRDLRELTDRLETVIPCLFDPHGNVAFTAPFAVFDPESGTPLLEVGTLAGESRLFLYAPGRPELPALALAADAEGGAVALFDREGSLMNSLSPLPMQLAEGEDLR